VHTGHPDDYKELVSKEFEALLPAQTDKDKPAEKP
jgi:hypothetical protein